MRRQETATVFLKFLIYILYSRYGWVTKMAKFGSSDNRYICRDTRHRQPYFKATTLYLGWYEHQSLISVCANPNVETQGTGNYKIKVIGGDVSSKKRGMLITRSQHSERAVTDIFLALVTIGSRQDELSITWPLR